MKKIAIFILILLYVCSFTAAGFGKNDIEWATAVEGTLHRGDTLKNGEYTIKAREFPSPVEGHRSLKGEIIPYTPVEPMVYLELYKNDILIKEVLISMQNEVEIDSDYEVKISGTGFPPGNAREWVQEYYDPWAKVAISLRGKPEIGISIETDKKNYISHKDNAIKAKIDIKNKGNAIAKNVDVFVNTGELKSTESTTGIIHKFYSEIKAGENKNFDVVLFVPDILDQKAFSLNVDTKSFDIKDLEYKSTGSDSITISSLTISSINNSFMLNKAIGKKRIYLNDIVTVKLTFTNSGTNEMNNIVLNDSLNSNFELESNIPLVWNIPFLKPGEWKEFQYSIKPLETNLEGFVFPAATAEFMINNNQYNISSESPDIIVNGPKIIINKTVDKQIVTIDEDVNVTVSVNNKGNIPVRTEVSDFIPENAVHISGQISFEPTFLETNSPKEFSYIIRMNKEGNTELPSAVAKYVGVEYKGLIRSKVESKRVLISVVNETTKMSIKNTSTISADKTENTTLSSQTTSSQTVSTKTASTEKVPTETTPAPITPGFGFIYGIIVISFTAVLRSR